jgi:hypothetical protein
LQKTFEKKNLEPQKQNTMIKKTRKIMKTRNERAISPVHISFAARKNNLIAIF